MATDHFNTVSKWLVARAVVFVLFGVYWPGKVSPPVINCSSRARGGRRAGGAGDRRNRNRTRRSRHTRRDERLPTLGFRAESCGNVGDRADRAVHNAAFEADLS